MFEENPMFPASSEADLSLLVEPARNLKLERKKLDELIGAQSEAAQEYLSGKFVMR